MTSYRKSMTQALQEVYKVNEQEDHEISMARGELEAIADKATQLASMLQSKSDEGNPLEAWVQSKITKAKDYITSVADYMTYNPDMKKNEQLEESLMSNIATLKSEFQRLDTDYKKMKDEYNAIMAGAYKGDETEVEKKMFKALRSLKDVRQELTSALKTVKEEVLEEKGEHYIDTIKKMRKQGKSIDQIATKLNMNPDIIEIILDEEKLEESFSANLIAKAKEIAKKLAGNMTKAYDEIEKIAKGLSKDNEVQKALRMANEELGRPNPSNPNPKEIEEGIMSDIFNMDKEGATAAEISKKLKLNIDNVKKILGKNESIEEAKDTPAQSDNSDELQKQISVLQGQVNLLKQKLENEKNKAVKAQPNRETGEVPLTVGIAHKLLKDKEEKEKVKTEEVQLDEFTSSMIKDLQKSYSDLNGKKISTDQANALSKHLDRLDVAQLKQLVTANIPFVSTVAKNKIYKKTGKFEERRLYVESVAAVKNKAEKTGMPYSILKQVYDRGMAAWKGGHRPGATQVQWALARVNSFVTKSSGTWGGADKDLAAKVGEKK